MRRTLRILFLAAISFGAPISSVAWADLDEARYAYDNNYFNTAFREYRPLAEQGNAEAQLRLGQMYEMGKGTAKDDTEAVAWYRLAADQDHPDAQFNLGYMYAHGLGVSANPVHALMWWRLASEKGHAMAQKGWFRLSMGATAAQQEKAQARAAAWRAAHP